MITLKTKIINIFNVKSLINLDLKELIGDLSNLIHDYERTDNFGYIECPNCHSDKLIKYGTYERNIGIQGEFEKINIKRVMCKECEKTHALIPSFILPFYQNERSFVIFSVTKIVIDKKGVVEAARELLISRQELNGLVKRFKSHVTRLKTTFRCGLEEIVSSVLNEVENVFKYQVINGYRFMEKIPT